MSPFLCSSTRSFDAISASMMCFCVWMTVSSRSVDCRPCLSVLNCFVIASSSFLKSYLRAFSTVLTAYLALTLATTRKFYSLSPNTRSIFKIVLTNFSRSQAIRPILLMALSMGCTSLSVLSRYSMYFYTFGVKSWECLLKNWSNFAFSSFLNASATPWSLSSRFFVVAVIYSVFFSCYLLLCEFVCAGS